MARDPAAGALRAGGFFMSRARVWDGGAGRPGRADGRTGTPGGVWSVGYGRWGPVGCGRSAGSGRWGTAGWERVARGRSAGNGRPGARERSAKARRLGTVGGGTARPVSKPPRPMRLAGPQPPSPRSPPGRGPEVGRQASQGRALGGRGAGARGDTATTCGAGRASGADRTGRGSGPIPAMAAPAPFDAPSASPLKYLSQAHFAAAPRSETRRAIAPPPWGRP